MAAPKEVLELVAKFENGLDSYTSPKFNETQTRREFIDPLFRALGWDIDNSEGVADAYKDVVHEDAIKVAGATKAPDYCFRVGGTRKFFLEAKKPSIDIKDDPEPAYQLRRYAWSAKLPLSILTDFQELAVYDCRARPGKNDKPSVHRVAYFTYQEYETRWEEIAGIFSRDAVWKGNFDKFAQSKKAKKGTAGVDDVFLEEIESWRSELARNLALRNPRLTQRELNYAVQQTIDRIIFLRICEDRGIENYGQLQALENGEGTYHKLLHICERADKRYNSGLFHFHEEPGQASTPDTLTPKLKLDDTVLKDIVKHLYYPESPYEFSVISADILGHVYEQFLGKVISLTKGHHAKVEEKPEVRKAGGVYYTPTYIVDYIVKNTVGKLLEGKTPKEAEKLKILDPACGSGSFVIGAYQYLLDWHLNWYIQNDPQKHAKGSKAKVYAFRMSGYGMDYGMAYGGGPLWRLTTAEKKRILLNNIYGVDIDPQAVEVTKLSLLLKLLEKETDEHLRLFPERVLPDLSSNIKCGNSLIGPDFYKGKQMGLLGDEEKYRINAFDWNDDKASFGAIMKAGGFDAVIGNPPYGAASSQESLDYFRQHYVVTDGTVDSYALFMEQGGTLLRPKGLLGMIVQSGWVSAPSTRALREIFAASFFPTHFASLPYDVFSAYIDTIIVIAERLAKGHEWKDVHRPIHLVVFPPRHKITKLDDFDVFHRESDPLAWLESPGKEFLVGVSNVGAQLIKRLGDVSSTFGDMLDIQRGVTPFHISSSKPAKNAARAFVGTVRRYRMNNGGTKGYIQYDETLAEYKLPRYFKGPRLLLRELISRQFQLQAVYTDDNFITNKSMQSLLVKDGRYSIFFFLALLNSKLYSVLFHFIQHRVILVHIGRRGLKKYGHSARKTILMSFIGNFEKRREYHLIWLR